MDFRFGDDAREMREALHRAMADTAEGAWKAMGVEAMLVPEADGGLGLDEVTLVGLLEETGMYTLPESHGRSAAGAGEFRALFADAAQLLGLADRMISMSADYARDRVQFGKPIGTFQAVKHHLATASVRLQFARPAVHRAAWSLSVDDPDAEHHVSIGYALAAEAGTRAGRAALQVHGAIGYTEECDLHRYLKRTRILAAGEAEHRARVLERVGRS